MSNLLGSPFRSWVTTQIQTRKLSLGKGGGENSTINSVDYQYQNSKTPFLRLASSVNLTNKGVNDKELENSVLKKLISLGVPEELITQDQLAQNFILQ